MASKRVAVPEGYRALILPAQQAEELQALLLTIYKQRLKKHTYISGPATHLTGYLLLALMESEQ